MSWRNYYSTGFSSPFGEARPGGRKHRGQDFSHSRVSGTIPVPALFSGRVVGHTRPNDGTGFGHGIKIESVLGDGNKYIFHYAHGAWASSQKLGEWVTQGQYILHEGLSGFTSGPCVHIEQQRVGGGFLNPLPEIRRVAAGQGDYAGNGGAPASGGGSKRGGYPDGSAELRIFQEKLIRMGHNLGPTGADSKFGPLTEKATRHEQTMAPKNGYPGGKITVDGVPGPQTNAYLDWWLVGRHQGTPTSGVLSYRQIQEALIRHGFSVGPTGADNIWGRNSSNALAAFQKSRGLLVDRKVGPATRAALGI